MEVYSDYANLLEVKFNDIEGAKVLYEKALEIKPDENTHFYYARLIILACDDFKIAKKHIEIALKINSEDAKIHYLYSNLLKYVFKDIINAKKHYFKAIELNPDNKTNDEDEFYEIK